MEKYMKEFKENPRYLIDVLGRVYDSEKNIFVCQYDNGCGYIAVKMRYPNGKRKQHYIHRLLAEVYLGCTKNMDINHLDGDKSNNCLDNLEIVTHRKNMQHAFDNKLLKGFVQKFY
jgi:hypothetical protein